MPGNDADWVLAVDARADGDERRTASAGPGSSDRAGPPLAVVVVHPATWDPARVEAALAQVAAASPEPGWPAPVPLTTAEAAAWRALEFGLVPPRGRLVVLDPPAGEAAVVDRDGDVLEPVGPAVALSGGPVDGERLVGLAKEALDAAPPGPPFTGVLLAGSLPGAADDAALPGLVASVTGRAPLVPGDVDRVAVLGAAALGWAAATAVDASPALEGAPLEAGVVRRPVGELPGARPATRRRLARPRLWAAAGVLLVIVAVVAGLGLHRARTATPGTTVTCPNGEVVAYRFECDTLAPSPSP